MKLYIFWRNMLYSAVCLHFQIFIYYNSAVCLLLVCWLSIFTQQWWNMLEKKWNVVPLSMWKDYHLDDACMRLKIHYSVTHEIGLFQNIPIIILLIALRLFCNCSRFSSIFPLVKELSKSISIPKNSSITSWAISNSLSLGIDHSSWKKMYFSHQQYIMKIATLPLIQVLL